MTAPVAAAPGLAPAPPPRREIPRQDDDYTAAARERLREHFGEDAEPFLVFNGTGANVSALAALTRPYEAVICTEVAHMHVDECGAPERVAGVKLLTVPTGDGKLTPADVGRWEHIPDARPGRPRHGAFPLPGGIRDQHEDSDPRHGGCDVVLQE